ncbi:hypothetical protein EXIGLDRAFT_828155 [Exidia glandulosa HHB12029]|uniref:F-box domain-containing protein n=1 Tax=Exidia glandulosa HHB12029 TaxID=1314781 RepID=A0A165QYC5_EXIGL|nr:hypothetical protein EXIGLDRAFT_828155 [Exidia glandulosa HHB12029]
MSIPAFDHLPSELLLEIFNYTEPDVRYATLKSLASTCRSVHGPAMTVLYAVVALRYADSVEAFANLARSGLARHLNLVRHLLLCGQVTIYIEEEDTHMACTDIILQNCPNILSIQADAYVLTRICLRTSFVCGFETAFMRLGASRSELPLAATAALVRLHIDDLSSFAPLRGQRSKQPAETFFTAERFPKLNVFSCKWHPAQQST